MWLVLALLRRQTSYRPPPRRMSVGTWSACCILYNHWIVNTGFAFNCAGFSHIIAVWWMPAEPITITEHTFALRISSAFSCGDIAESNFVRTQYIPLFAFYQSLHYVNAATKPNNAILIIMSALYTYPVYRNQKNQTTDDSTHPIFNTSNQRYAHLFFIVRTIISVGVTQLVSDLEKNPRAHKMQFALQTKP